MKRCSRCGENKAVSAFYGGHETQCKSCRLTYLREKRQATWPTPAPDLPGEAWRDVVGYEGFYRVSNLGRVRRVGAATGARPGSLLSQHVAPDDYPRVSLYRGGLRTRRARPVHRLVAEAFIERTGDETEVNHIDGVKVHNMAMNLEWITPSGNIQHAMKKGLFKPRYPVRRGVDASSAKVTESDVREIRRLHPEVGTRELSARYGLSLSGIKYIVSRKNWSHVL